MRLTASLFIGFILLSAWTFAPAGTGVPSDKPGSPIVVGSPFFEDEVKARLSGMYSIVGEVPIDEDVMDQVKRFVSVDRTASKMLLQRREQFFPVLDKLFMEADLPSDLKFLAAIESGLNPAAKSGVGAAGLWQFMPGTAKILGLKVDAAMDQRLDVVLSTKAAIKYLQKLYNLFGDWALALAAYNCGEQKIIDLIDSGVPKNFWEMRKYLPRQTQLFVPAFIGMNYMMQFYGEHDLLPDADEPLHLPLSYAKVYKDMQVSDLLSSTKIDKEIFYFYNPAYRKGNIPGKKEGIFIALPDSLMTSFVDYYVIKFETKDGLTPEEVRSINPEDNYLEVISFSRPYIFQPEGVITYLSTEVDYTKPEIIPTKENLADLSQTLEESRLIRHIVKAKESIADVAIQYPNVGIRDLIDWNQLDISQALQPGQILLIRNRS